MNAGTCIVGLCICLENYAERKSSLSIHQSAYSTSNHGGNWTTPGSTHEQPATLCHVVTTCHVVM